MREQTKAPWLTSAVCASQELLEACLHTSRLRPGCAAAPPVSLLIRTSGERRLSDFVLSQAAQAALDFTDVLWPDLTFTHLLASLLRFQAGAAAAAARGGAAAAARTAARARSQLAALRGDDERPRGGAGEACGTQGQDAGGASAAFRARYGPPDVDALLEEPPLLRDHLPSAAEALALAAQARGRQARVSAFLAERERVLCAWEKVAARGGRPSWPPQLDCNACGDNKP